MTTNDYLDSVTKSDCTAITSLSLSSKSFLSNGNFIRIYLS